MSNVAFGGRSIKRKSFGTIKDTIPVPNLIHIQSSSFNNFVQLDCLPEEREIAGLERVFRDVFSMEYEDKFSLEYISYELGNWACTCGKLTGIEKRYSWQCSRCDATGCSRLSRSMCPSCKKDSASYVSCSHCASRVNIKLGMTMDAARVSGQTFSMPLKVRMQLVSWDLDQKNERVVRDIKQQDLFFADLPVMGDLYEENGVFKLGSLGTFIINGVDRIIVSQLHRSPGVVFSQSKKTKDFRGRPYCIARVIPMRGSWIDFEFDNNDLLYVRIDKKKKILITTFLQALGFSRQEIIGLFYKAEEIAVRKGAFSKLFSSQLHGQRIERWMLPANFTNEKEYVGKRITAELFKKLESEGVDSFIVRKENLINKVFANNVVNEKTGEILFEQGTHISESMLDEIAKLNNFNFAIIQSTGIVQPIIATSLAKDRTKTYEEALKDVHVKLWPGEAFSYAESLVKFHNLFFNSKFYDLTKVGRVRINRKFNLSTPEDCLVLTKEDIVSTIHYLINLNEKAEGILDDIDHLGNRRVRLVGELLSNQMYQGFARVERIVKERFRMHEQHGSVKPQDLISVKPIAAVIREFFGLGQLSQFSDQTNPMSELSHKRRLSALGPGGVLKDRATFEVRDVHSSHYGRICPIETPEGQTVGLISSLATHAVVNELGFIETPYRPVKNGIAQNEVVFFDAFQEADKKIAQIDALLPGSDKLKEGKTLIRKGDEFQYVDATEVDYIDLSSKQLVSVSAALIPFLEHDDAVRALMGANMQRQAVPLIKTQIPLVATGMEREIIKSSGAVLVARRPGNVVYVSSEKIVIEVSEAALRDSGNIASDGIDEYYLKHFQRSSYSTWIHHAPAVRVGDEVKEGDIITNGPSIKNGELALGKNLLVAFMLWRGYNFEDAILLNKRLVTEDEMTSVHIEEFSIEARDTKLGPEEITRDIPNISEKALESLDEDGIVRVGTRVKAGDILVGKVTLKGDIQYSPEEKLLRAIFGEKSREVRDTSLHVPPGIEGTIVDVKIFSRSGRDPRYKKEATHQVEEFERNLAHHLELLHEIIRKKIITISLSSEKDGFDKNKLNKTMLAELFKLKISGKKEVAEIKQLKASYENQLRVIEGIKVEKINELKKGDSLPSGVIKIVKVFIAMKRPISVGDKLAGRHGNKGVVSAIVAPEDMPFLHDGTAVDIVLNPLGIPSRMNIGQVLETILGFAGREIGVQLAEKLEKEGYQAVKEFLLKFYDKEYIVSSEKTLGKEGVLAIAREVAKSGLPFETPVFDSANFEQDIKPMFQKLQLPEFSTFALRDGYTGEFFDQPVTVGALYVMKLIHMVDDKLHARSVGPYSLITQQPLGGKAQQGGQRLGEMEVWALEAYGAAYTLQEMLTYKSDDVSGRHKAYQAIVRGDDVPAPGVPESFNVLIKELQSLGLQIDLLKIGKENISE
jgi:DNA-directed RNA polymerase subunit beta